jgi:hypothetical protein
VRLAGAGTTISGADTRMGSDADGSASPVLGIAVGQAENVPGVEAALAAHPASAALGKNDPVAGTIGPRAIAHDTTLSSAALAEFVNAIKHHADIAPAGPYTIRNVGADCVWHAASNTCWGTTARPKVVHVKGDGAVALAVSGDSGGTGILVVEDGALEISGAFRWNGPVIVRGRGARVRFTGDEPASIWGTLVVDDTAASGTAALDSEGAGRRSIRYSAEAMGTVLRGLGARRLMSLAGWQER